MVVVISDSVPGSPRPYLQDQVRTTLFDELRAVKQYDGVYTCAAL